MAQQLAQEIQKATSPFQYALSTRAGVECIFHMLEALTAADDQRTVISIDGIGAFDSISRSSMLTKLASLERASRILPFGKLFYGEPSEYLWENAEGVVQKILQGEGGEQGGPVDATIICFGTTRRACQN